MGVNASISTVNPFTSGNGGIGGKKVGQHIAPEEPEADETTD
jgi:hypothetical protein